MMRRALPPMVVLAALLWSASLAHAEPRCLLETKPQALDALLASARDRNRAYVAPSVQELRQTRVAIDSLLDALVHGKPLEPAQQALTALHWQLVPTTLAGASALVVIEEAQHQRGRGAYVWRCDAALEAGSEGRIVQVPHSFFDAHTLPIGLALAAHARALFVNTVHRYPGGVVPAGQAGEEESGAQARADASPADLAHQPHSVFQVMTAAALERFEKPLLLQVHGFADRADPAHKEAGLVISPGAVAYGAAAAKALVQRLAHALHGVGVCLYPRDTRVLGGTGNAQGRIAAKHQGATFLHVEISSSVRKSLIDEQSLLQAFVAAVWGESGE